MMKKGHMSLTLILLASLLAAALSVVRAPLARASGADTSVPISPYLIGQNAWYQPPDSVWPLVGQAGVTSVRIGGSSYDQNMPDNTTLLHWIDEIHSIGAEPIIQVSRYPDTTGSQADLAQLASNAAALVQFVNITSNRHVQFWSIGNEPDLSGHYPCGATTEADMITCVANYVKAIAPAMRAVDPSIKIYAPDAASFSPTEFSAWLGGSADITGKDPLTQRYYIDGVTFHRYPFSGSCTRDAVLNEMHLGFPATVQSLLNELTTADARNGRTGADALTWGLTEFNISDNNPSPNDPTGCAVNSFLNGQFFAEYLGQGMKYNAVFFNTWSINEGWGNGSPGDLGFLGGDPANQPTPRSSYYHMQMISNLKGSFVPSSSNQVNVPAISAMNDTQENVMILNEDTTSHTYTLRLNGDPITTGSDTQINVLAGIAQQYTDTIPGQTSILLTFDLQGNLTQSITYSLSDDQNNQPPHTSGWWTFGNNPAHTHVNNTETQLSPSTVSNLRLNWSYTTADMIYSSPAVVNGIVYVGSQDHNIYALDASTGTIKWTFTTGSSIQNSSPTVMAGMVYIGSRDHNLYALDAVTGTLRWKYTTGNEVWSSPTYANGLIYVGSYDGYVYALDAFTGALQWRYNTGAGIFGSPAVANGTVYVGSDNDQIHALDAASGTLKWNATMGGGIWSSPTVANGTVYAGSFDGKVYALDASTGTVQWTFTTGNVVDSSPAVDNGIVYVGSIDGNLYALDASSGNKLWNYTTNGPIECSPTIANGVVYFGSDDHTFYALNAASGGTPLYTYTTGWAIVSAPAVVNGMVYIGSGDHSVYAFQLPSGQ